MILDVLEARNAASACDGCGASCYDEGVRSDYNSHVELLRELIFVSDGAEVDDGGDRHETTAADCPSKDAVTVGVDLSECTQDAYGTTTLAFNAQAPTFLPDLIAHHCLRICLPPIRLWCGWLGAATLPRSIPMLGV